MVAAESTVFKVVLVEDDDGDAELILAKLASGGVLVAVTRATNEREVRAAFADLHDVDAVLCDYNLPDFDALRALEVLRIAEISVPLIVVSGGLSDERAAECMRLGAIDYILKDRLTRLPHALTQAIQHSRAEHASREVERSYLRLFENVPLAVIRATADGQILHANPAAVEMHGFADLDSFLGRSMVDLHVDPNDRATLLEQLHREGRVVDFESRMRREGGSEFWFSGVVQAVREKDGRVVEIEVIGRDATERREATRRLRESEAYLSTVIETAPDAVVRMDESGAITDWNSAAQDTFGWKRADVIGRRVSETIIPPGLRQRHEEGLKRFHRDGSSKLIGRRWDTFEGMRKDGEVFPIELALSPPIPWGDTSQFVGFARDISERRRAERELAQSEERFRSVLAGSPLAVVTADRAGRFTFAGGTVFAQMGVDPSSVVGLLATERFSDRPEVVELLAAALDHDIQTDVEFGRWTFHVRCGPFRLAPDGEVIGVLAVAFDNTERVEADRALRQSEVEAERRLSRRVAQQTVLLELSRAGLEGGDTAEFLARAVELVTRGTETQFGTILELRPTDNVMIRVAAYGQADGMPADAPPLHATVLGADALKAELRLAVAFDYQARPELPRSQWMIQYGVVASMAVGIDARVSPFGVLSVHSSVAREFSAEDLQFMQLASTIVSVAIERKHGERQRRMLLGRLVTAQEVERKTIAEDIHDDAVQVMTAANMRLELFRMVLTDPVQIDAAVKLQETISLATGRLRNLLFQLSPPDLDRHGLAAGFTRHLEQFEADAGLRWELQTELDDEPPPQVRILLFRIFQEALVNVRKHARATTVTVSLQTVDGGVLMRLADDGAGFHESAVEPRAGHLGLASMRERAEIAGGWWRLSSEPGRGTEVLAWVPAPRDDDTSAARVNEVMAIG